MQQPCEQCGTEDVLVDGLCDNCQSIYAQTLAPESSGSAEPTQAKAGQSFGEYDLIDEVARGGMGVIYKARHRKLNRVAALKMILSGRFSSDEELQRFHIEAEAAANLDHPGIVPVYEIGEVDGQAFFAMKFIEGGSLADRIQQLRQEPRKAIELLAKVARAVHHAHQRGVLHRDLKPANILIGEAGEPLITDLGLAKNSKGDSNLTNTGAVLGTPSYMPPEQASGNAVITTAADIYSLGAIMYELLTGVPPYKGATAIETVMQVLEGPPPEPRRRDPSVNRDLELICMKCLQSEPTKRYGSAFELTRDLEAWLAGDSISVRAPSLSDRTARWFKQNRSLAFGVFAVLTGLFAAAPFMVELLVGDDVNAVYDRFPESDRPLMFVIGNEVPGSTGVFAALFLILILWPSVGWLNARIMQPVSILNSIWHGLRTSVVLGMVLGLLLGWIVVGKFTTGSTGTERLAQALWPPDPEKADKYREVANNMFKGLEDIPVEERAALVTKRIRAEQLTWAPVAVGAFLLIFGFVSIPIVYGTIIGYVLLNRGNSLFVSLIRHIVGWWSTTFALMMCIAIVSQANSNVNYSGPPQPVVIGLAAFFTVVAWLSLRRWRKGEENTTADSRTMLSSAT